MMLTGQRSLLEPGRAGQKDDNSGVRGAVLRFLLMGLAALLIVATPVAFWILGQAERHALDNAMTATQRLADLTVGPAITDALLAEDKDALAELHARLAPWIDRGTVQRIKVWDSTGRIVYSDVAELIGDQHQLEAWAEDLLSGGEGTAVLEPQNELENEFETDAGPLVEVYVPARAANGEPLIVEAYYDDAVVRVEQATVLWDMAPVVLVALAVLQLAQLVPAAALARRIRNSHAVHRRLLQRSIEASDLERRRIARDLGDEVIQDLAGLSYAFEAAEMRATSEQRPLLTQAHEILQDNMRLLREMTREICPANLETMGLPAALDELADPLREAGIQVTLHGAGMPTVPRDDAMTFCRVAREALVNVLQHARAGSVELELEDGPEETVLRIRDDGCGFDYALSAPDRRIGLRIMKDTIDDAGGQLAVMSVPGSGTVVEARLGTNRFLT